LPAIRVPNLNRTKISFNKNGEKADPAWRAVRFTYDFAHHQDKTKWTFVLERTKGRIISDPAFLVFEIVATSMELIRK
jgi:hypothetical protein